MASKTEILNRALNRIGQQPVNSINDTTSATAQAGKLLFEPIVREVSRKHPWNCLKARATLVKNTTGPAFGWAYSYTIPTDCLRVITVNGYDYDYEQDYFEIEGRDILTDATECKITYIAYVEDTEQYDPIFTNALAVRLGAELAGRIGRDPQLSISLIQEFENTILPDAKRVDGKEENRRKHQTWVYSSWVKARRIQPS